MPDSELFDGGKFGTKRVNSSIRKIIEFAATDSMERAAAKHKKPTPTLR
jgi:hypothetical protein